MSDDNGRVYDEALRVLEHLHKFNKLDEEWVDKIGKEYGLDARDMCREHGITYTIPDEEEACIST